MKVTRTPQAPTKLSILIAQDLARHIADEHLTPGARLPQESELAESLGVGRATVREALHYLEMVGLLTIKRGPGGGAVVQQPDSGVLASTLTLLLQSIGADFESLLQLRLMVEPEIARVAAATREDSAADALAYSAAYMGDHRDDPRIFSEEMQRFHEALAWAAGNATLGFLIESVGRIRASNLATVEYPPEMQDAIWRRHAEIADAVTSQDPEAAARAMREHLGETVAAISEHYAHLTRQQLAWTIRC